jgi:hypothetical protein
MIRSRLVCAGAAALVAAVGFAPVVATGAAGAPMASAPKTICVGLVIDARSIGGSVNDGCATVKPGSTGIDVLEAAGHSVTFRSDGLLCTIDGLPKSGCGDVDNTHYWAYFHRAPGRTTWSYSNEGASTYEPVNRSTEGWVYDDGTSLQPENIPAAKICSALVKSAATPTPSQPAPSASPAAVPTETKPKSAVTKAPHHRRSPLAIPSAVTHTTPLPTSSGSPRRALVSTSSGSAHSNATGALIAAGLIAVLAGAAITTARRRRN